MIIFIVPKNSGLSICKDIIKDLNLNGNLIEIRGEDIPLIVSSFIKENKKVIGITGEDLLKEFLLDNENSQLKVLKRINWNDKNCMFEKPTLCLLGPKNKRLEDLPKNLRISLNKKYAAISNKYLARLEDKGFCFEKIWLSGATEETFQNKLSDIVIDIVYSGKSAKEAGLEVYDKIISSDIVIIGGKNEEI